MTLRLQEFGHAGSAYERPSRTWVCGRAAEGTPCAAGPDARGRCGAKGECEPIRRGDRWHCTRPEARGGSCADGPLPDGACARALPRCQPVRSLRAMRAFAAAWTAAGIAGGLLCLIAGPWNERALMPGPISAAHGAVAGDCSACHAAAARGPIGWTLAAPRPANRADQVALCLKCHDLGTAPDRAHGLPAAVLALSRDRLARSGQPEDRPGALSVASFLGLRHPGEESAPPCAACHPEHHGGEAPPTRLDDGRCQGCHARVFTSLAKGHPGFSDFPKAGTGRVAFGHLAHIGKHFMEGDPGKAPAACTSCHAPDDTGRFLPARGFDAACSRCHLGQIVGEGRAGSKGVPFLAVPGLDLAALGKQGARIGGWPQDADGGATPFMDLLLAGGPDPPDGEAIRGLDLLDLGSTGADQIAAVERYARGIKALFLDIATSGHEALRQRLEAAAGPIGSAELADLLGRLPADIVRSAQQDWFRPVPPAQIPAAGATEEARASAGGWYRDDFTFSILYRPGGHADPFLRAWIDLAARLDAETLLGRLADPRAPGACGKCHRPAEGTGAAGDRGWRTSLPSSSEPGFGRFAHAPHLGLSDRMACQACHALDPQAGDGREFAALPKEVCSSCHRPGGAGHRCLTCHNYHVGRVTMTAGEAPLDAPPITGG